MAGSDSNNLCRPRAGSASGAGARSGASMPLDGGASSGNGMTGKGASGKDALDNSTADGLDGVTQKLPQADSGNAASTSASGRIAGSGSLSGSLSGGTDGRSTGNSGPVPQDSVASRRLAHGLSPEATAKADAAELRRKEKEASAEDRKRKFQRQHKAKVVRRTLIAVAVVLVVGAVLGFWLLRWGLHDDASSIQGQWRVKGTDTVINITDEDIVLTDEVAYDYVIDPDAKTLAFTFGGLTGNGRYRFSLDHSQLAIDDGEFDWGSTLMADIPWTVDAVAQKLVGHPEKNPSLGEGDMVLERM